MNEKCFGRPQVLATIMMLLFCAGAAAQSLRWAVGLNGQDAGAMEVIVDTTDLPTNVLVDDARFRVRFYDGQKNLVGEKSMAFVDAKLPVLQSGHVYQRDFRHGLAAVQTVVGDTLSWSSPSGGPKADSPGGSVKSVAKIEKSPDVKVSSGSPKAKVRKKPS